jgi:hypothetical protein
MSTATVFATLSSLISSLGMMGISETMLNGIRGFLAAQCGPADPPLASAPGRESLNRLARIPRRTVDVCGVLSVLRLLCWP